MEGTSMKWLQLISGYYFASSCLRDVRFSSVRVSDADGGDGGATWRPAEGVTFTFYLDPTEPLNSDDPTKIYNPEVINCIFL